MIILLTASLPACKGDDKNKGRFKYTIAQDSNLYLQIYRTGLFATSTTAYLTDSATFSQKLGTYDDETGYINCKVKGDTIISEAKEYLYDASQQPDTMKTVAVKIYSLKALKLQHNFK